MILLSVQREGFLLEDFNIQLGGSNRHCHLLGPLSAAHNPCLCVKDILSPPLKDVNRLHVRLRRGFAVPCELVTPVKSGLAIHQVVPLWTPSDRQQSVPLVSHRAKYHDIFISWIWKNQNTAVVGLPSCLSSPLPDAVPAQRQNHTTIIRSSGSPIASMITAL